VDKNGPTLKKALNLIHSGNMMLVLLLNDNLAIQCRQTWFPMGIIHRQAEGIKKRPQAFDSRA
jgi:hypothetical protein